MKQKILFNLLGLFELLGIVIITFGFVNLFSSFDAILSFYYALYEVNHSWWSVAAPIFHLLITLLSLSSLMYIWYKFSKKLNLRFKQA